MVQSWWHFGINCTKIAPTYLVFNKKIYLKKIFIYLCAPPRPPSSEMGVISSQSNKFCSPLYMLQFTNFCTPQYLLTSGEFPVSVSGINPSWSSPNARFYKGASTYYMTLFLPIFDPPPCDCLEVEAAQSPVPTVLKQKQLSHLTPLS